MCISIEALSSSASGPCHRQQTHICSVLYILHSNRLNKQVPNEGELVISEVPGLNQQVLREEDQVCSGKNIKSSPKTNRSHGKTEKSQLNSKMKKNKSQVKTKKSDVKPTNLTWRWTSPKSSQGLNQHVLNTEEQVLNAFPGKKQQVPSQVPNE